jgi:hypothetical protein
VDLAAPAGRHVLAVAAGQVTHAGWDGAFGRKVEITHTDGTRTWSAHLSAITVAEGAPVAAGDVIGLVGATGNATGPHLHFEVRVDGRPVNPQPWLHAVLGEGWSEPPCWDSDGDSAHAHLADAGRISVEVDIDQAEPEDAGKASPADDHKPVPAHVEAADDGDESSAARRDGAGKADGQAADSTGERQPTERLGERAEDGTGPDPQEVVTEVTEIVSDVVDGVDVESRL